MTSWVVLCTTLFLVFATPSHSQNVPRVIQISVEGNRKTTSSLITGVAGLTVGQQLSAGVVQEAISRLWGLGVFDDVRIEAEEVPGGLHIFVLVHELPKLTGLRYEGNKRLKAVRLNDELKLGVGGYISPFLVTSKAQEIRTLYAKKGFYRATVQPTLTYTSDSSEATLLYSIDEQEKVKVSEVLLTGNTRVPSKKLTSKMRNRPRGFLLSSTFAEDKFEEDLKSIVTIYRQKGFVDAEVLSDSTVVDTALNTMKVYVHVYEGPLFYFGNATFASNSVISTDRLEKKLKFKEGDVFSADRYDKSIFELYTGYQEIGHLHVRIADIRTTRADSILDINYDVTEGLPSTIRFVNIVGNTKTKDRVIRRELSVFPGQVFNRALLIQSVRDAMALNFFTNVEPTPIDLPNGDVDLEFKIEEKQTAQVSAGAGYNSQDKIVGNVGLGIPNLDGNGQNLSFNIEFGGTRNSASLSFTEPWLAGYPTLLGVDIFSTNRRYFDEYTEERQGGSVRIGRRLNWPDRYFRGSVSYRLERTRNRDFDALYKQANSYRRTFRRFEKTDLSPSPVFREESVETFNPLPGSVLELGEEWNTASRISFSVTRDSRNLPEFATNGSRISYSFETTGGFMGGFWDYQHHQLSVAKFIPLIGKIALAAKVEIGAINAPKGDRRVILSDRYSPGGTAFDGIVRGYDDGELTPDTAYRLDDTAFIYFGEDSYKNRVEPADSVFVRSISSETRVRGKYLFVANMEIQVPLVTRQVYGLLFYDAGATWLNNSDINIPRDLYEGIGAGFRVVVPGIGTIGFDFGYPLDTFTGQEKKFRPHFQIGTTFR